MVKSPGALTRAASLQTGALVQASEDCGPRHIRPASSETIPLHIILGSCCGTTCTQQPGVEHTSSVAVERPFLSSIYCPIRSACLRNTGIWRRFRPRDEWSAEHSVSPKNRTKINRVQRMALAVSDVTGRNKMGTLCKKLWP
jgi:hypothetical protein